MPRTKVSKNSKRNREAAIREEKIREFDSAVDQYINALDFKIKQDISEIETEIVLMKSRFPQKVLLIKIGDLLRMNVAKFSDIKSASNFIPLQSDVNQESQASSLQPGKKPKDDEGYITEDSRGSGIETVQANLSIMRSMRTSRMPGPLSSAKARKSRRSRSASGYISSTLRPKPSACNSSHVSRQKMRTPMSKPKAISADRTLNLQRDIPNSPTALLRWPKPGELVISVTGSPVVAQVVPEQYANVNIPIRDGVLSLRPKKLNELDPEIVHKIDQETLSQIKLLQSNLELIMRYADKTEKVNNF